jgi:diguanylate cyclase
MREDEGHRRGGDGMNSPPPSSPEELAAARVASLAPRYLGALRDRLGLRSWVVARWTGEAWVPVAELGGDGAAFPWSLLCRRLAQTGAAIAPHTGGDVELAAQQPKFNRVGAYAGAPLRLADGRVLGVVAGADRVDRPDGMRAELPFLVLTSDLLSALLSAEVRAAEQTSRAEAAETMSRRDPLTGLGNRRSWDRLLVKEEERCRRYGLDAAVIVVDLDELKHVNDRRGHAAGDDLLRLCARTLSEHTREPDDVARIGGDEFAILASDCGPEARVALVSRLQKALRNAGVSASIGAANRASDTGLSGAWTAADEAMYKDKRDRRPPP